MIFSLTGCVKTRIVYKPIPINIPASQFECASPETRPNSDNEILMESKVAKYIANLEKVIPDCKLRLKETKAIIECFNDEKCNPDSLMKGLEVAKDNVAG